MVFRIFCFCALLWLWAYEMKNIAYGSQLEPNKYRHHSATLSLYQNVPRGSLRPIGVSTICLFTLQIEFYFIFLNYCTLLWFHIACNSKMVKTIFEDNFYISTFWVCFSLYVTSMKKLSTPLNATSKTVHKSVFSCFEIWCITKIPDVPTSSFLSRKRAVSQMSGIVPVLYENWTHCTLFSFKLKLTIKISWRKKTQNNYNSIRFFI